VARSPSALVIGLLLASPAAAWDVPPAPSRQFEDRAGFVTADVGERLDARLRAERERTGREIVVVVLPTLPEDATPEDFGARTAQAWRVGRRGLDDGVVLFVFAADRRLRLEVGYGLEAALPDVTAKRILDDVIAPRLRQGDRAGALEAGVDAILAVAGGGALPAAPPPPTFDLTAEDLHRFVALPVLLALGVFWLGPRVKARPGHVPTGVALGVAFTLIATVFGMLANAEATLRAASAAAGAGLAVAASRPAWPLWIAGRTRGKLEGGAVRTISGVTAVLALLWLGVALGWGATFAGWSVAALASLGVFQAFCVLGVWRAKLWSERILYLGLGGLIGFAYVQPAVMDGRFPSFLLVFPWAPIWSGVAVLLNGLFSVLGLKPRRWWYDDSGRQAGLAGGGWSSRGYSGGGSSGYLGGGGRFGGGGASGSW